MTSKPGIPSPVIDVELLAEAWGNVMDGRRVKGRIEDVRLNPDTTTADDWAAIAAEYQRLASEPSIPVEEGSE